MPGPIPKRSNNRVRRNKPEIPIDKVTVIGRVGIPELEMPYAHPLIQDIYRSLADSAQSQYYEPSDWQLARLALHFADRLVRSSKPSAQMLVTVNQMLTDLLVSEGSRRRVRMEVERDPQEGQLINAEDVFRQRLMERTGTQ